MATVLRTSPRRFVSTQPIDRLTKRALRYLQSGYGVHLRGAAGTGKTTLAFHLADQLQRPMMLMFGDDEAKTSDLIGKQSGYTRKKVVDNYIHSVVKVEDQMRQNWVDSRLTLACREGYTLIYDEFNRSRPEVNNVLLSVLEEKILVLPPESNRTEYLKVSPQFRAIFTSNPEEYCGVHSTQDALMDRLVTIDMPEPDELTQCAILLQKTELDATSVETIVRVVQAFRSHNSRSAASGLRAGLMIGKICRDHEISVDLKSLEFQDVCADVLLSRSTLAAEESMALLWQILQAEWESEMVAIEGETPIHLEVSDSHTIQIELVDFDANIAEPEAIEPEAVEPEAVEPEAIEPEAVEPEALPPMAQEETVVKLDSEAWKAVLEEERSARGSDRDLSRYVDLSDLDPNVAANISSELEGPEPSTQETVTVEEFFAAIMPEAQDSATAVAVVEAPVDTLNSVDTLNKALSELVSESISEPVQPIAESRPNSQSMAESIAELSEPSIDDRLFQYLLTQPKGVRLSQIESDLRLSRVQTVDAIRALAKTNRLAQRDRHFFALT